MRAMLDKLTAGEYVILGAVLIAINPHDPMRVGMGAAVIVGGWIYGRRG